MSLVLDHPLATAAPAAPAPAADSTRPPSWFALALALVALGGVALRLVHWRGFTGTGFDETLYVHYLNQLHKVGLGGYPDIVDEYLAVQRTLEGSILPPTRFLYIFCAYLWHGVFGGSSIGCFHAVSQAFSVGTLALAGGFVFRLLSDRRLAFAAFALLAFSPLQIHFSQHALADGFFEFWVLLTLWGLWESLHAPGHRGWLAMYTLGLAAMVTTKENAFFVFAAILALLTANRWFRFGTLSRPLLILTLVGPLIGVAVLANIAGGLPTLIGVYQLGVPKNMHLAYAIATGDGPWYRYWIDLLTMSPLVFVLAFGMIFQLRRDDRALWFGLVFIAASFALMANVKYGMNLRYASIWDLPLRLLAVGQASLLAARVAGDQRRWAAFAAFIAALCAFDLNQYYRLAVQYPLYELVPLDLFHALHILK